MIKEFQLEKILPNPYQTRDGEDPEHIRNLAISISEQGLLQIPLARIAPGQQGTNALKDPLVQLAFGHSRLAAYKFLRDTGNQGFDTMPLNILNMSDEQMFQVAVSENLARKDLNPIEEAKAMLVYRDQFRKTSEEIGRLFHLSDSAIRNKLRLLDLPSEVQAKVGKSLTEGAARDVLVFLNLPENAQQEKIWNDGKNQSFEEIIKNGIEEGIEPGELKEIVDSAIEQTGERMDRKLWKNTDELIGDEIIGLCKGCKYLVTRDGTDWCMNPSCFKAKEKAFERSYLSQASLISGIAILEEEKESYNSHTSFHWGDQAFLEKIRKKHCENLRLVFDRNYQNDHEYGKFNHLAAEGFERAEIVCSKRPGQCTCAKAEQEGVEIEGGEDGVSEEDLKEARRQMLENKRHEEEMIKHLKRMAALEISGGLDKMQLEVWRMALNKLSYPDKFKELPSIDALFMVLSEQMIERSTWGYDKDVVLKQLNELLVKCGLDELDISFGEVEYRPDDAEAGECVGGFVEQPVHGKNLIDVFDQEDNNKVSNGG